MIIIVWLTEILRSAFGNTFTRSRYSGQLPMWILYINKSLMYRLYYLRPESEIQFIFQSKES